MRITNKIHWLHRSLRLIQSSITTKTNAKRIPIANISKVINKISYPRGANGTDSQSISDRYPKYLSKIFLSIPLWAISSITSSAILLTIEFFGYNQPPTFLLDIPFNFPCRISQKSGSAKRLILPMGKWSNVSYVWTVRAVNPKLIQKWLNSSLGIFEILPLARCKFPWGQFF